MKNSPPDSAHPSGSTENHGLLHSLLQGLRPPEWVVDELQNRVVLFLNHVLGQEAQAQDRLRRQKGKCVRVQWGDFHLTLAPTPAGLLERVSPNTAPDLAVTVSQTSPLSLAQTVLAGDKPAVDIRGDVQLAAEVAWLVDNLRWDLEEDLSRLVGDGPAHALARMGRTLVSALRGFLGQAASRFPGKAASPSGPTGSGSGSQG
jgi:ubiquinone biosynthesis accessory factor UbiJ